MTKVVYNACYGGFSLSREACKRYWELQGKEVWIGYADKGGITSERIVEPLTITGGFLTAFDVRTNEVRTFTVARITGAELAENVDEEGTA